MTAGAHPTAAELGVLTDDPRYQRTLDEYGERARRQLVSGLHLHVSLGGADRSLAVYNAFRSYLPEIAALAANAPFHGGRDTGLASIRPTIAVYLQRQGVPPVDPVVGVVRRRRCSGARPPTPCPDARRWWFELRLHATYGTLGAARARRAVERRRRVRRRVVRVRPDAVAGGAASTRARRCRCTTRGGSTRTAGRRCATASRARSPIWRPASGCRRASCCARAWPSLHPDDGGADRAPTAPSAPVRWAWTAPLNISRRGSSPSGACRRRRRTSRSRAARPARRPAG